MQSVAYEDLAVSPLSAGPRGSTSERTKLPLAATASTTRFAEKQQNRCEMLKATPPATLTDTTAVTQSHQRTDPIDKLVGKVMSWPFGQNGIIRQHGFHWWFNFDESIIFQNLLRDLRVEQRRTEPLPCGLEKQVRTADPDALDLVYLYTAIPHHFDFDAHPIMPKPRHFVDVIACILSDGSSTDRSDRHICDAQNIGSGPIRSILLRKGADSEIVSVSHNINEVPTGR